MQVGAIRTHKLPCPAAPPHDASAAGLGGGLEWWYYRVVCTNEHHQIGAIVTRVQNIEARDAVCVCEIWLYTEAQHPLSTSLQMRALKRAHKHLRLVYHVMQEHRWAWDVCLPDPRDVQSDRRLRMLRVGASSPCAAQQSHSCVCAKPIRACRRLHACITTCECPTSARLGEGRLGRKDPSSGGHPFRQATLMACHAMPCYAM
ncbi:hypothetical protein V8C26DRAFT_236830 [Trichoderma gracile]